MAHSEEYLFGFIGNIISNILYKNEEFASFSSAQGKNKLK